MKSKAILAVLAAMGLWACSGNDSPRQAETGDGATDASATNLFVAGETVASQSGEFRLVFSADPFPAQVGENELVLDLTDKEGNPVSEAFLAVEPWMPAHNHGSDQEPVLEALGDGKYRISGISYTMGGLWELRIHVNAGAIEDDFVLGFQVPRPTRDAS